MKATGHINENPRFESGRSHSFIEDRDYFLSLIDDLKTNFTLEDLKLSSSRLKQINNKVQKQVDLKLENYSSWQLEYLEKNHNFRNNLEEDKFQELKIKEFKRFQDLLEMFPSSLENIRNYFRKVDFQLKIQKEELKDYFTDLYQRQLELTGKSPFSLPQKFTEKFFKSYLNLANSELQKSYLQALEAYNNCKNNIMWSESYFNLFLKTNQLNYLQTSFNLLLSGSNYFTNISSKSGFYMRLPYFCRSKFDSATRKKQIYENKQIINYLLEYHENRNHTWSFLTLSPNNVFDLQKEDLENLSKIIKEFFRQPEIEKVYKGYFGVPEVKYKGNDEWNVHFHFLVLRHHSIQGKLNYEIIRNVFNRCCNIWGNHKFKDSYHVFIEAPHKRFYEQSENNTQYYHKISNYILSYIQKGIEITNEWAREKFIQVSEDIQFFRSGGLLSKTKFKEYFLSAKLVSTFDQENQYSSLRLMNSNFKFGKNYIVEVDINKYWLSQLMGFSTQKHAESLFKGHNKRAKSDFYHTLKDSYFGSQPIKCPFTNPESEFSKLKFKGTKSRGGIAHWKNDFFIIDALKGLGLENESIKYQLNAGFPDDIDTQVQKTVFSFYDRINKENEVIQQSVAM